MIRLVWRRNIRINIGWLARNSKEWTSKDFKTTSFTPVKNTKSPKSSTQPAPASRSMFCSQPKQNVNPTLQATLPKQNTLKLPQSNVGFINLGNTCYANSMLHALSILPELWNLFPSKSGCTPPLLNQFLIIMTWLKRHKTSIDPSGFLRALSSKMSLIHNHPFNFSTQQCPRNSPSSPGWNHRRTSVLANNFLKTTIRTSISCTSFMSLWFWKRRKCLHTAGPHRKHHL